MLVDPLDLLLEVILEDVLLDVALHLLELRDLVVLRDHVSDEFGVLVSREALEEVEPLGGELFRRQVAPKPLSVAFRLPEAISTSYFLSSWD